MRTVRLIASSLFAAWCVPTFAQYSSPELMLVADTGNTLIGAPGKIDRYDPYTGAYLGSFGAGYLKNPIAVSVIGSEAYVSDDLTVNGSNYSRIFKFNFSTGAYDGMVYNGGPYQLNSINSYNGNLVATDRGNSNVAGYAGIWTLTPTGGVLGYSLIPGPTNVVLDAGTVVGSNYFGAVFNSAFNGGGIVDGNLDANGKVVSFNNTIDATEAYFGIASAAVNGQQFIFGAATPNGLTSEYIRKFDTSGNMVGSYQLSSTDHLVASLAAGHNGMLYGMSYDGTVTRYDGGGSLALGPLGTFKLANTVNPYSIAVYAAPEPVTMVGLALGTWALVSRRRRKV